MQGNDATPVLELKGVSKSFGAVIALRTADLALYANSIHAVVGENGAGKSTLVKIIAGLYQRDAGTFRSTASPSTSAPPPRPRRPASPSSTRSRPCSPTSPSPRTSSWAASPPAASAGSTRKAMRAEVADLMERLGVRIDPDRPAEGLSIADQQIIEIAKAISPRRAGPDHGRADRGALRRRGGPAVRRRPQPARRGQGADVHLAPLRGGLRALRHGHGDARRRLHLHRRRSSTPAVPRDRAPHGRPRRQRAVPQAGGADRTTRCSRSTNLTQPGVFHDISFTVRAGEIVGLAGLVGAGRSEVARAIFGVDPYVQRHGARSTARSSPDAARASP